jgi:hypothetical protein
METLKLTDVCSSVEKQVKNSTFFHMGQSQNAEMQAADLVLTSCTRITGNANEIDPPKSVKYGSFAKVTFPFEAWVNGKLIKTFQVGDEIEIDVN